MSQLVPFSFEASPVRVINHDDGNWSVVAKDVAAVLEYADSSNPARLFAHVPEEWKGVNPIHTLGGEQEMLCLTEQGLYFFLNRSDKPKALPLQKWVAGEVLPSIRKTGSYSLTAPSPVLLPIETSIRVFTTAETFARNVLGLAGNFAKLSADLCVTKATGLSVLEYFGQHLLANPQGQTYNPTELGTLYGGLSARKINFVLELANYQHHVCGKWTPTDKATGFYEWIDTNKRTGGSPVKQLRWFSSILEAPDFVAVIDNLIGAPKGSPTGIEIYS